MASFGLGRTRSLARPPPGLMARQYLAFGPGPVGGSVSQGFLISNHWSLLAPPFKAGLASHRLHGRRHTALAGLPNHGVSPRVVREIVGHASFATTEKYAKSILRDHLYDEAMKGL